MILFSLRLDILILISYKLKKLFVSFIKKKTVCFSIKYSHKGCKSKIFVKVKKSFSSTPNNISNNLLNIQNTFIIFLNIVMFKKHDY